MAQKTKLFNQFMDLGKIIMIMDKVFIVQKTCERVGLYRKLRMICKSIPTGYEKSIYFKSYK